jgi:hypothetical protein
MRDVTKLEHLLHPVRAARVASTRLLAHLKLRRFASQSKRHFKGDSRYDLKSVEDGFISRIDDSSSDTELFDRIFNAYSCAVADQRLAASCYEPTGWWKELRKSSLGPVMQALQCRNIEVLRSMYRNFFRDRCVTGLIAPPFGLSKAYFKGALKNAYCHAYMGDALCRIDYWISQTGGRFPLSDLRGPLIGNPYGACFSGTLVRTGAEYQHYCAQEILKRLDAEQRVIVEIGGGYGGVGYYLLRDGGKLAYIDFDTPESIALTSYYLLKAFPSTKALLYGERPLTPEAIAASDVVLMPLFEMERMPAAQVSVTFSSHSMSDLSRDAMGKYLDVITHMTADYFIYIGNDRAANIISDLVREHRGAFAMLETKTSGWNRHKAAKAGEVECLYGHRCD